MAFEIIAPNMVQPPIEALVNVSRARALLAPLDQSTGNRFDVDQVRELIGRALRELSEAFINTRGRSKHV